MARYNIPDEFINGFHVLCQIDDNEIREVSDVFNNITEIDDIALTNKNLEEKLSLNEESTSDLTSALMSVLQLKFGSPDPANVLIDELVSAADRKVFPASQDDRQEKLTSLKNNLTVFLNNADRGLNDIYHSMVMSRDYERVFLFSKILTDIRFDISHRGEYKFHPTHQLKIEYQDYESKEIYFALDNDDLVRLRRQIDSALQKDKALREIDFIKNHLLINENKKSGEA